MRNIRLLCRSRRFHTILAVLVLVSLTGCTYSTRSPLSEAAAQPASAEEIENPVILLAAEPVPTAVIAGEDSEAQEGNQNQAGTETEESPEAKEPAPTAPTPASDPLKITFPDSRVAPISAWRPPLYPTPWALAPYDHFYFTRPIAADEVNWPLWDYRYGGMVFEGVVHTGIDITAAKGTPVIAAGSGEVTWAGYGLYYGVYKEDDPYGLAVAIHHDFGYNGQELYTIYGHLDQVDVVVGQRVEVGDRLGLSGATGNVTGPHLHFEVRVGSNSFFKSSNPELWLVPPTGWGVLVGTVMGTSGYLLSGQEVYIQSLETSQSWLAKTYWNETVHSDSYYQENMVIGDLPAGRYEIRIPFLGKNNIQEVEIFPGAITYFSYQGRAGFSLDLPAPPEFIPEE